MKSRIIITLSILLVLFFGHQKYAQGDTNPNSPNGLPCTTGQDYRSRMQGPWNFETFDSNPNGPTSVRYSPRYDILYYAQCLDPATTGALQTVLANVIADGNITKEGCDGGKNITFDNNGNLRLCSEEDDSYVGIRGTGADTYWLVAYYETSPSGPVIPPIPGEVKGICGDDVFQAGARAKNPTAIYAECRDKVWFQRNVDKALSCSSNFTFRGSPATQWKSWRENAVEKVVRACDGDNVANADKILSALEELWSSCLPGGPPRKGISCVCSVDEDVEGTPCEGFISDIGPPVINSISHTTAGSFQPITVTGKFLGNQIVLTSISGTSTKIPVEPEVNANYLTFEVPDVDNGEYSVISSGSNGSSVESIKLTVLQGAPFPPANNLPVPSRGLPTDLGQMIGAIFIWSLGLIGLVIFVRFFYAGFLWFTAAGNASNVSKAKDIMWNAVYGTLILFSAWLILNTINPDLVRGTLNLPGLPATQNVAPSSGGAICSDTAAIARKYNEPATAQNDPKLTALISCIKSKLPGVNLGSEFTTDQSKSICNLTRGNTECGTCSHTVNSCHYGGRTGVQGALAVDFGNEDSGDRIIEAAINCGVPATKARCENSSGNRVVCSDTNATHVHISETSCDAN